MPSLRTTASLLTMALLGVTPALAQSHGSSAASHSPSSATLRSTAPAARTGSPTATTPLLSSPTAIAPGGSSVPQTAAPGAMAPNPTNTASIVTTTTSPLAPSQGAPGSSPNLSSANSGAVDQNAATDPTQIQSPAGTPGSPSSVTSSTTTTGDQAAMPTPGDQILGANGVQLPNVGVTTSGAVPMQPSGAAPGQVAAGRGEVDATSGGSSGVDLGVTGRDMPECMRAWDAKTHITKPAWRQICARTLIEPHI